VVAEFCGTPCTYRDLDWIFLGIRQHLSFKTFKLDQQVRIHIEARANFITISDLENLLFDRVIG
jgi:hypothetical protein